MAEMVGQGFREFATGSLPTPGDAEAALPVDARAEFEHEAAALDLSEAE